MNITCTAISQNFRGTIISCADEVILLKDERHSLTVVNAEKFIAIWGATAKRKEKTD